MSLLVYCLNIDECVQMNLLYRVWSSEVEVLYSPGHHSSGHHHQSLQCHHRSHWTLSTQTVTLSRGGSQPSSLDKSHSELSHPVSIIFLACLSSHLFLARWYNFSAPLIHLGAGLATSALPGCRSSTGVRAGVSVSWVSHWLPVTPGWPAISHRGDKRQIMLHN